MNHELKDGDESSIVGTHERWCSGCNQSHGILYICEKYPDLLKKQLLHVSNQMREKEFHRNDNGDWIMKIDPYKEDLDE